MPSSGLRRIFIIGGLLSLFASYLGLWARFINDPVERTGADFIHFYTAGRIAQLHGTSHVYDLELQRKIEEALVGFPLAPKQILPYNHLPFLIPLLQWTMSANYVSSFYRWVLIMLITFVTGISVLSKLLRQVGIPRRQIGVIVLGNILFLPVFYSFMNGQDTAILFLGAVIWIYGLIRGKETLSGIGLTLTIVRPHIALLIALPMIFSHRKVFLSFALGVSLLIIFSISILGITGSQEFINIILLSAVDEGYGIKPHAMYNLLGLLTRVFPSVAVEHTRLLSWIFYVLSIIGLSYLWARKNHRDNFIIGVTVIMALFAAPHLYFHDLTLLLIPMYGLLHSGHIQRTTAMALPIAVSILFLASNISVSLQFTTPYLAMLALAAYPYYSTHKNTVISQHRSRLPKI